jgi:hypothetical protein
MITEFVDFVVRDDCAPVQDHKAVLDEVIVPLTIHQGGIGLVPVSDVSYGADVVDLE